MQQLRISCPLVVWRTMTLNLGHRKAGTTGGKSPTIVFFDGFSCIVNFQNPMIVEGSFFLVYILYTRELPEICHPHAPKTSTLNAIHQ